ncbi:cholesterol 24-hydroxylase-like [Sardina pilchardus]|uniref:cholesterol 24-hydroxylase-like n=1 Tax=Sardina pilchardus TaxID=27697 RepID=UPI002E11A7DC
MALIHTITLWDITVWTGYLVFAGVAVAFVAFVGFVLYTKYVHRKFDHIPGPPRKHFLSGHMVPFLADTRSGRNISDTFLQWVTEAGGPVCRLNFYFAVVLLVTCPEATKEILMSPKYGKDPYGNKRLSSMFGVRFLGNGLLTAMDHNQWHKQRRIMDPAFSSLYLRGLMGVFNERAECLMGKLEEYAERQAPVQMDKLINTFTLDVITKVAFGVDLDLFNSGDSPFPRAIELCLKGLVHYTRDQEFESQPENKKVVEEIKEAILLLRKTGKTWIDERRRAVRNGENVPKDILTQILKSAEESNEDDEETILDNFVTFFIAGQETTANQLSFAIVELGRHPEILSRLTEEVDEVIGMKQEISYEDLGNLTYLTQVLKETLRLYPTAPMTTRRLPHDMVIDGMKIPGGCVAIFSSYVSSRLERFFKDPLTFDPERFHLNAPKPYFCYYPFSLGPRSCIGQNFSQLEAKVALAKLVQRFDFSLVPGQSFEIKDLATLRPQNGVRCTVKLRDNA